MLKESPRGVMEGIADEVPYSWTIEELFKDGGSHYTYIVLLLVRRPPPVEAEVEDTTVVNMNAGLPFPPFSYLTCRPEVIRFSTVYHQRRQTQNTFINGEVN